VRNKPKKKPTKNLQNLENRKNYTTKAAGHLQPEKWLNYSPNWKTAK
jgi:hypothetical protein